MGHIGLTPQSATALGGFKAQGRTAEKAIAAARPTRGRSRRRAASRSCSRPCPPPVAASDHARAVGADDRHRRRRGRATARCSSGTTCSGSTTGRSPRFVKRYADLAGEIQKALEAYAGEVRSGAFPEEQHTYSIPDEELALFEASLENAVRPSRISSGTSSGSADPRPCAAMSTRGASARRRRAARAPADDQCARRRRTPCRGRPPVGDRPDRQRGGERRDRVGERVARVTERPRRLGGGAADVDDAARRRSRARHPRARRRRTPRGRCRARRSPAGRRACRAKVVESTPAIPARTTIASAGSWRASEASSRVVPQLLEHGDGLNQDEHRPRPPEALRDGRWRVRFHSPPRIAAWTRHSPRTSTAWRRFGELLGIESARGRPGRGDGAARVGSRSLHRRRRCSTAAR